MDQAALFPFIMSTVDSIINQCDQIEMEKERNKRDSGGGQSVLYKK